jgi:hypothetical protein
LSAPTAGNSPVGQAGPCQTRAAAARQLPAGGVDIPSVGYPEARFKARIFQPVFERGYFFFAGIF